MSPDVFGRIKRPKIVVSSSRSRSIHAYKCEIIELQHQMGHKLDPAPGTCKHIPCKFI